MPQPLEDLGGWPARATADAFTDYAEVIGQRMGDRIRHWITLNEPWCSAFLGYHNGEHAPGRHDLRLALRASHTLLLAHGRAVQALRAASPTRDRHHAQSDPRRAGDLERRGPSPPLGATTATSTAGSSIRCTGAAIPPTCSSTTPSSSRRRRDEDLRTIAAPIDLLGVNYYQPNIVRHDPARRLPGKPPASSRRTSRSPRWAGSCGPAGLHELLVRLRRDYPVRSLAITENGAAYRRQARGDGRVADPERTRYLAGHLEAAAAAIDGGVPLVGYFAWSLLDNFEWAWGFTRRFGIVHVDFETQRRTVKDSGHWYREFIGAQGQRKPHARPA